MIHTIKSLIGGVPATLVALALVLPLSAQADNHEAAEAAPSGRAMALTVEAVGARCEPGPACRAARAAGS